MDKQKEKKKYDITVNKVNENDKSRNLISNRDNIR